MRSGWALTLAAVALSAATAFSIAATTSQHQTTAWQLVVLAMVFFATLLALGSSRSIGVASVPMLAAAMIEVGVGDEPSWVRSIMVGCLWYLTLEVGWEAIDRRDDSRHTLAANLRRTQEVATVVALALGLGLVATVAADIAPVRSVVLQAVTLIGLLAGLVALSARAIAPRSVTE